MFEHFGSHNERIAILQIYILSAVVVAVNELKMSFFLSIEMHATTLLKQLAARAQFGKKGLKEKLKVIHSFVF